MTMAGPLDQEVQMGASLMLEEGDHLFPPLKVFLTLVGGPLVVGACLAGGRLVVVLLKLVGGPLVEGACLAGERLVAVDLKRGQVNKLTSYMYKTCSACTCTCTCIAHY